MAARFSSTPVKETPAQGQPLFGGIPVDDTPAEGQPLFGGVPIEDLKPTKKPLFGGIPVDDPGAPPEPAPEPGKPPQPTPGRPVAIPALRFAGSPITQDPQFRQELTNQISDAMKASAPAVKTTLEGVLGGLGGAAGTFFAGPAGGLAGGTLGYATAQPFADLYAMMVGAEPGERQDPIFEQLLGVRTPLETVLGPAEPGQPQTLPQQLRRTADDLYAGAQYELFGNALFAGMGALARGVFNKTKQAGAFLAENVLGVEGRKAAKDAVESQLEGISPLASEEQIRKRAGRVLNQVLPTDEIYTQAGREAQEAVEQILGFKATVGELTGDPETLKLQRALERQPGTPARQLAERRTANRAAITDFLEKTFPEAQNIDEVTELFTKQEISLADAADMARQSVQKQLARFKPVDPQTTGAQIREAVETAKKPVLQQEKELWKLVENYELDDTFTEQAFKKATKTPSTAMEMAQNLYNIYKRTKAIIGTTDGATVDTLKKMDRQIRSEMKKEAATDEDRFVLAPIRDAIERDFEELVNKSDAGIVAFLAGEPGKPIKKIKPQQLKTQLQETYERIAKEPAQRDPIPDYEKMYSEIMQNKDLDSWDRSTAGRAFNEGLESYRERLIKHYQNKISQNLPMEQVPEPIHVQAWRKQAKNIERTLAKAQPGTDVAARYKQAKAFSKVEKFERFDKGAIQEITRKGSQYGDFRVRAGKVAEKFMTDDGADELIRALASKKQAGDVMIGHYADQLDTQFVNQSTGEIRAEGYKRWLKRNERVLKKYGIFDNFDTLSKATQTLDDAVKAEKEFAYTAAAKILKADPKQKIKSAMQGVRGLGPKSTGKIMQQLMKQMRGDKQAITGLQNAFKDFMIDSMEQGAKETLKAERVLSPAKARDLIDKFHPAMERLYANAPKKLKALKTVARVTDIEYRSGASPIGGGSDTAENIGIIARLFGTITKAGKRTRFGKAFDLASVGLEAAEEYSERRARELVYEALVDPELAQILIDAALKQKPVTTRKAFNKYLLRAGLITYKDYERNTEPKKKKRKRR